MVRDAYDAEVLPPAFASPEEIEALSGKARKPTLEEAKEVFKLHHFARCSEYQIFKTWPGRRKCYHWDPSCIKRGPPADDDPARQRAWREDFDRAAYRSLLLGAVLADAYNRPIIRAAKEYPFPEEFLLNLREYQDSARPEFHEIDAMFDSRHIEFLRKFPVYNYPAKWNDQPAFRAIATWLVNDARDRARKRREAEGPYPPPEARHFREFANIGADDMAAFWELVEILVAQAQIGFRLRRRRDHDTNPVRLPLPLSVKLDLIFYGEFQVETVGLPRDVEHSKHCEFVAKERIEWLHNIPGEIAPEIDIPLLLDLMRDEDEQDVGGNPDWDEDPSPAAFDFFHFTFREFFDLRVKHVDDRSYLPHADLVAKKSVFGRQTWSERMNMRGVLGFFARRDRSAVDGSDEDGSDGDEGFY
jgi:hypothetical protein